MEAELIMLGMDRPRDDPDGIPDVPQSASSAARVDRGAVVIDARTQQEYAAAYRAAVDAAYQREV
jgi:hypothetical protein